MTFVVQDPPEYVPLTAVNVVRPGYVYVKNVTPVVVELVRPLESVAVTVIDLDPALKTPEV